MELLYEKDKLALCSLPSCFSFPSSTNRVIIPFCLSKLKVLDILTLKDKSIKYIPIKEDE